ncbi:MarR family transcriptional regulator [Actinomadura sp. KC345]|uniref:MarR family winged helix-turn-helix transcriptional regulator n=1 Tax=Actinomadura sp. KC345 TaxID=2530371 RepID=UPI001A9E51E4|nr:MarR family transcriptional regulator [Actinomadura sp. KC345]
MADVYELAGLSRRTSETFAREVSGQSVARWHVMSVVSEEPATVPAIARRLGHRRQSVQRVVDALARMGHVAVKDNPAHRRSPLVTLTPAGEIELGRLNITAETVRAAQLKAADVGVAELASARETLRALIAALRADEPSKPSPPSANEQRVKTGEA